MAGFFLADFPGSQGLKDRSACCLVNDHERQMKPALSLHTGECLYSAPIQPGANQNLGIMGAGS